MRLALLALAVLALAIALVLLLRRPPPPSPSTHATRDEPATTPTERAIAKVPEPALTRPAPAPDVRVPPSGAAPSTAPEPTAVASERGDAALAAWHARSSERDYAYWDMKLNMLRKIQTCVGDKLHTRGAAEVNFHFKKQDGAWLADGAEVRDPSDEERAKMGGVDFRGADRQLAQQCISEAFAGTTMPATGGTEGLEQYEVRGQIMFPTSADRAWRETGVNP